MKQAVFTIIPATLLVGFLSQPDHLPTLSNFIGAIAGYGLFKVFINTMSL